MRCAHLASALLTFAECGIALALLFEDVRFHQLANGVRVILDIVPQSDLTAIGVCVRAGSKDEPEDAQGVAHLVEHLIFKRAGMNGGSGTQLGALCMVANAETSFDYTAFYCALHRDMLYKVPKLMCSAIFSPEFDQSSLELEKKIIKLELAQRSEDPLELARTLSQWLLFRSHPYAHPFSDSVWNAERLTLSKVLQFHRANYLPQNITVICSGSFDELAVLREIMGTFGAFNPPLVKFTSPPTLRDTTRVPENSLIFGIEMPFNAVSMSFLAPGASEPEAFVAGEVIANCIGDPNVGELARFLAKYPKIPVTRFSVSFAPRRNQSALSINLLLREGKHSEVERAVLDLLNSFKKNGISGDELLKFKRLTELRFRKRCSDVLGRVKVLAEAEGIGTYKIATNYINFIENLSNEQFLGILRRIFSPNGYAVAAICQKAR